MQAITLLQAQEAILMHSIENTLTVAQLQSLLSWASITAQFQIRYVTKVQTAAQHKEETLQKVTTAIVTLRSVADDQVRDGNTEPYVLPDHYEYTDQPGLIEHATHAGKYYLYVSYNSAKSVFMHNSNIVDKQHVAQYLTPSAKKLLLAKDTDITTTKGDVATVRMIALTNIVSISAVW